jgi:hypothetical protein
VKRPLPRLVCIIFFCGLRAATARAQTAPAAPRPAASPATQRQTAPPLAPAPATPSRGAQPAPPGTVEIDPIRCWTRSSQGAVRIGETFTVTLTCAVLETEGVQVLPDESKLGVTVVSMNPFETVGGAHPPDIRTNSRRFFQYDYYVRMISPDSIGQDVTVPLIQVSYRINSRIAGNQQMQGRELSYVLPTLWVKVLSMVPQDATDIRDTSEASFSRIESMSFRAGVLEIVATTLVVLGSIMTLLALVALARRARKVQVGPRDTALSRPAVCRLAVRELSAAQREAMSSGWTDGLINRATSALRLSAAEALGRPVNQRVVEPDTTTGEGRLVVRSLGRGKATAVSAAVTSNDLARAMTQLPATAPAGRRELLEQLQTTLTGLASAQYSRPGADRGGVDTLVNTGIELARQVRSEHSWPRELLRRFAQRGRLVQRQA